MGGVVSFLAPEGTIKGTVEVDFNLTYRVGHFTITQRGENRIVVAVQPGGVILTPGFGQRMTVAPMDPDNPVVEAEFKLVDTLTLQRLVSHEMAQHLLNEGEGFVLTTSILPPGVYKLMIDDRFLGTTAHVEMGKGTAVFPEED